MTIAGNATLANIRDLGDGRMHADLDASSGTVRLDEGPLLTLGTAAAVIAAGTAAVWGLAILIKFLAALFSRQLEHPLTHRRRVLLYGTVVSNPGATMNELAGKTGLGRGVAQHHLNILAKAGLIVKRQHNSRLCYFENHGRYDASWRERIAFREPELEALYEWVRGHPGALQMQTLDAMEEKGWSRSTTQHRLGRLEEYGMVIARKQGRTKRYWDTKGTPAA
jgi:predicted transcriptional regulator